MGRSDQRADETEDGLSYRDECARKASGYERFLCEQWIETGRTCTRHFGKTAQLAHGDLCINGYDAEVKFDQLRHESGNVYIEVAERRSSYRTWVNSGIYATSAAVWYMVGDYTITFVFRRSALRAIARDRSMMEIERGTSKGFLLTEADATAAAALIQPWRGRTWNGQLRSIE